MICADPDGFSCAAAGMASGGRVRNRGPARTLGVVAELHEPVEHHRDALQGTQPEVIRAI